MIVGSYKLFCEDTNQGKSGVNDKTIIRIQRINYQMNTEAISITNYITP